VRGESQEHDVLSGRWAAQEGIQRIPNPPALRGMLEAHLRYEHACGIRRLVGAALIALSVPVWLSAARPSWFGPDVRRFTLAGWAVCFVALLAAAGAEWRWYRGCMILTDGEQAPPRDDVVRATSCAERRHKAL
jgi:hypothetical protein